MFSIGALDTEPLPHDMQAGSILAIADDLTGALEAGAKFASNGLSATVVTGLESPIQANSTVLVIDAETRHRTPLESAVCVKEFVSKARNSSLQLIYKKTDSTLRGNIAAELRAIQDLFPGRRFIYVPAYPEMGRTVEDGELFVWGTRVHETEFAHDRWHPVRDCKIRSVLGDVDALITDGKSNADIDTAVQTILAEPAPPLCAGPAALAEALARHFGRPTDFHLPETPRFLVVNGSMHPASGQQIDVARRAALFNDDWIHFSDAIPGVGLERALKLGESVRRKLQSSSLNTLVVFGGDTAFGVHQALGSPPFRSQGEILPGVPLSESCGLHWITKAGGFGDPDLLLAIRDKFVAARRTT
ncbi:MAG TPA: four-carbon acid sugar kinase family protein [Bryobacteraceae bacterium]|jgi:uncharacterized protein YgbK (DUF1537 family)|nr:four-carbon acid sugar kinase family protein [Bryobacteraceae bacterium]